MKKRFIILMLLCMSFTSITANAYLWCDGNHDNFIRVTVNGKEISNSKLAQIVDNRTLVPVRSIAEALGARVDWNADTQDITIKKDNDVISLKIGSQQMSINGEVKTIDVSPMIYNDTTLVPVRFVSEALKANVAWANTCQKQVTISTSKITPEQAVELTKAELAQRGFDYYSVDILDMLTKPFEDYYYIGVYFDNPHEEIDYDGCPMSAWGVHRETGEIIGLAG